MQNPNNICDPHATALHHMQMPYSSEKYPLSGIEKPTNTDVLCGRGVSTNRHPGNEKFRSLVGCNKELYVTSTKKQKMRISRSIVEAVRSLEPPGRFLEKDQDSGTWFDIGDKKAIEKTSQALRDGAASLRKQLSQDLNDPEFLSAVFDTAKPDCIKTEKKVSPVPKKTEKKGKPPAKSHKRSKSNPIVGTTARAKTLVLKKHKSVDGPMSPHPRPPISHPPSPRMIPQPSPRSPQMHQHPQHPGAAPAPHQRATSMPMAPYPVPGSPIYQAGGDPNFHPLLSPTMRNNSFDQYPPEHFESRHPPRPYGPPSPTYQFPPSPATHPPVTHPPATHPPATHPPRSPYAAGPNNRPYHHQLSPRWSPHHAHSRRGPYLHPRDFRITPERSAPPALSPRAQFSRSPSYGSAGLAVPQLGGERPLGPPSSSLPMSPVRYPPPSPHGCYRTSPYRPPSPPPHDFTPPHPSASRRRTPSPYENASSEHRRRPSPMHAEADFSSPRVGKKEVISKSETRITVNNMGEKVSEHRTMKMKSETPPAVEVELVNGKEKEAQNSPAAVAEVMSSSSVLGQDELMMSAKKLPDANYPSDEEPNPADEERLCYSPLPFSGENPDSLMELPDNLLSLPISPVGPIDGSDEEV